MDNKNPWNLTQNTSIPKGFDIDFCINCWSKAIPYGINFTWQVLAPDCSQHIVL